MLFTIAKFKIQLWNRDKSSDRLVLDLRAVELLAEALEALPESERTLLREAYCGSVLLQRASLNDTIRGTFKAILGFVILQCGAEILVQSLDVFGKLFEQAYGLRGIVPNNEAVASIALNHFGAKIAFVMFLGMLVNIIIARLTPLKCIFLMGHHILFMAALMVMVLHNGGYSDCAVVIGGAVLTGVCLSLSPAMIQCRWKSA